jgi:putative flippase GtrA
MKRLVREVSWFIAVGCAAAATHWLVAVAGVRLLAWPPLWANVLGWSVAFFVSFSGHYRLTFRYHPKALGVAFRRFFLVSLGGFLINEVSYAYLLHATAIPYDVLLACILVALAFLTFVTSRLWAFRHRAEAA